MSLLLIWPTSKDASWSGFQLRSFLIYYRRRGVRMLHWRKGILLRTLDRASSFWFLHICFELLRLNIWSRWECSRLANLSHLGVSHAYRRSCIGSAKQWSASCSKNWIRKLESAFSGEQLFYYKMIILLFLQLSLIIRDSSISLHIGVTPLV